MKEMKERRGSENGACTKIQGKKLSKSVKQISVLSDLCSSFSVISVYHLNVSHQAARNEGLIATFMKALSVEDFHHRARQMRSCRFGCLIGKCDALGGICGERWDRKYKTSRKVSSKFPMANS